MQTISSLADIEALLQQYAPANAPGHIYSLERMQQVMDFLGNPQNTLRMIHVAGTSGKTSTCYYLAALLQQTGKKVGLTVSPHIDGLNERVQIDLTPLPLEQFCSELTIFLELVQKSQVTLSRLEFLVAFAFWEFARQQVDYVVLEVGVGGTLDTTNVIENQKKVCVITDIGLDHQDRLGETLTEIAGNKAGIIGLHNLVFCYEQGAEVMSVIKKRAHQQQADLHMLDQELPDDYDFLPLFQRRNFGLARAVISKVLERDGLPQLNNHALQKAATVRIPARMELFEVAGKKVILDGAHNAQKLQALHDSLRAQYPGQAVAALVASKAKQTSRIEEATEVLTRLANHIIVTSYGTPNTFEPYGEDPDVIAALCKIHGFWSIETIADPAHAWRQLLTRPEPILVVTGSFYLFNEIRPLLKLPK